jgi:hypothetical protein
LAKPNQPFGKVFEAYLQSVCRNTSLKTSKISFRFNWGSYIDLHLREKFYFNYETMPSQPSNMDRLGGLYTLNPIFANLGGFFVGSLHFWDLIRVFEAPLEVGCCTSTLICGENQLFEVYFPLLAHVS